LQSGAAGRPIDLPETACLRERQPERRHVPELAADPCKQFIVSRHDGTFENQTRLDVTTGGRSGTACSRRVPALDHGRQVDVAHHRHWTFGRADDSLGHTSHQQMRNGPASVRPHHNQIGIVIGRNLWPRQWS